jgi:two-component system, cell cycle sensor histidine kinase and response regulator CckA
MLRKLTTVATRDNDSLTSRRGQALALVLLLLLAINGLLAALRLLLEAAVSIHALIALVLLAAVYAINRSGRVRLAVAILQIGAVLLIISGAVAGRAPLPALVFLNLIVVTAAAFGRPLAPLLWAAALTGVPFVVNLFLYGSPLTPNEPIALPNGAVMPSILALEIILIALLWMIAGTAYLASRLLNQLLDESRAATAQTLAANQSLRQSEERFAKVFHFSPVAIAVAALTDGRFIDVNEHFVELTGYRHDEVIGSSTIGLDVWSDAEKRASIVQALRKHQPIRDMEATCHTRSGVIRKVLFSAELIDLSGEPCALVMFYDTTERKQVEVALRESEERYRLITQNTSDLISILDRENRVVYLSPSHRQVLGIDPDNAVGTRGTDLIHPDDQAYMNDLWLKLQTTGTAQATFRYRHADGSWRWLESSATVTASHDTPYIVIVARDVTERRRLEAQFLQAQKMESVGRLAGGVAHDFNNLLTVMTGYGEMAREALPTNDPARGDLDELLKAAERANDLTRQLLAFARKQIIEPRVLNLNDLILDMDRLLRRLIGEDIELVTRTASDLGWVKVDPGQIEQVIVNLAVNARDAMPDGGKLTIETKNAVLDDLYAQQHLGITAGAYVLLAISDTGVGMDAEVQSHLFEPFFTTKAAGKGTGLGLATSYGIIKQHNGAIGVYSEVGHGTTFKIYLPCAAAPPEAAPPSDDVDVLPRGVETVLLVEDEVSVRTLAARVLRAKGYTVLEAANGDEALTLVRDQGEAMIDVLLTDVIMPQTGGRALADRLAALLPGVKVLFMSGYTDDAIVHHDHLAPGIAFLHKPFSPAALARKVREVLDTRE